MTEKELKEEIKRLKEKLQAKNKRVSESTKECKKLKMINIREDRHSLMAAAKYWAIQGNFPEKYYRVKWSGVNEIGTRNPSKIELIKGLCANHVITVLEQSWEDVQIDMIEEVAT